MYVYVCMTLIVLVICGKRKIWQTFGFSQNNYIEKRRVVSDVANTATSYARIGSRLRRVDAAQFEDGHAKLRGIGGLNFRVYVNAFGFDQTGAIRA